MGSLLLKKDKKYIPRAHVDKEFKNLLFMMYQFEN